ncbi:MAG: sugar phosphate isomerase/epimerase [Chitinophagaceae bacterium]|nr:sugar phosphate isomerase/epimerase [Chitinophagaceae bacterium]
MNRKEFLINSSLYLTGIKLTGEPFFFSKTETEIELAGKINLFGLQLYTLREDFPKDPKGVLAQVASYGYRQIESFEGPNGMFWGMRPKEFKNYINDLGMELIASHCNVFQDMEKKAAEAAEAGMKYLICPWIGPQKTMDDYKKMANRFNELGEICRKNGLRFAYHNHDYSFKPLEGRIPQEILMQETEASLVDFEMDIYWVVTAGADPAEWLKKNKNRFRLSHVKDRSKNPVADNSKNSVDLGTGSIPFRKLLRTALRCGMEYFIVEQEAYPNGSPLEAVRKNAEYMKRLGGR